jgi:hypothetical protein
VTVTVRLLALAVAPAAVLAAQPVGEYDVKAAFLFRFAKFVEWPPEAAAGNISIGMIGRDPFGGRLENLVRGKWVNGRELSIIHLRSDEDPRRCHIVFISASERGRVPEILHSMRHFPILTVGDSPGFCAQGGVIGLKVVHNRVQFDINLDAAERARLKISSKLLTVASSIREGQR